MTTDTAPQTSPVIVYWRPGCPFCSRLRADLHQAGLSVTEVNIWQDLQAAATVRTMAGGNETVPTVTVGNRAMVNPSAKQVIDALDRVAPETVSPQARTAVSRSRSLRLIQWVLIVALVVAGVALESRGLGAWGWACDGAAVAAWLAFGYPRRGHTAPHRQRR